ncbi:hypothetical protein DSO57_1024875 [Entomophthora muscae]|uniref:Uncharacterized protein n=1 Tax=Entomophthora muscae TaxID=34485 RepID=A0ACC2RTH2_9FUNG|nr:hypothetical protein DSO57_1024875 [Entomophthora muscae]
MGYIYFFVGLGEFIGPIISGFLLDTYADYNLIIYLTIAGYTLALISMCLVNFSIKVHPSERL